ncbi:MAG: tetratricopeptide repeat protein [Deltaproteobacteria bacterium]|nr:tetratricopeptide repeat protein [Deltaproteobacteria bacterium]
MRALIPLCGLIACAGRVVPPVSAREDPAVHAVHLVAFHATKPHALVFEPPQALTILDVREQTARPLGVLPPQLARRLAAHLTDPGAVLAVVRASDLAADLENAGYLWPRPSVAHAQPLPHGSITLAGRRAEIRDDERTLTAAFLSPQPARVLWWLDRNEQLVALSVCYEGVVAACDLRAFVRAALAARLVAARGYAAHSAGRYEDAARDFAKALALDPTAAETAYNLACAQARLGLTNAALASLEEALARGGARLRALARVDPDLEPLRVLPEVQTMILENDQEAPTGD